MSDLRESRTTRVAALIALVTIIPAKLKKAMERMVPMKAAKRRGLWPSWTNPSRASSSNPWGPCDQAEPTYGQGRKPMSCVVQVKSLVNYLSSG